MEEDDFEIKCLHREEVNMCGHRGLKGVGVVQYNSQDVCVLLDTGAQVCLISESALERIQRGDELEGNGEVWKLKGLVGAPSECTKIVMLQIETGDDVMDIFPFAVVKDEALTCCMLIGINFLVHHRAIIDFRLGKVVFKEGGDWNFGMNLKCWDKGMSMSVGVESEEEGSIVVSEKVKFVIAKSQIEVMQSGNHAIKLLKSKILNNVPAQQWKETALKQFKRYKNLELEENIVIKRESNRTLAIGFFWISSGVCFENS